MRTYYIPHFNIFQRIAKFIFAQVKNLYNKIFSLPISIRDVKRMRPTLKHYTAKNVGRLLFRQSLRDDIAKSESDMVKNWSHNPYLPNKNFYYDPKTHIMYKYNFKKDIRHYVSINIIEHKLLSNSNYLAYCQKVANKLNNKQ